jgi:hypothetical protein
MLAAYRRGQFHAANALLHRLNNLGYHVRTDQDNGGYRLVRCVGLAGGGNLR